MFFLKNIIAPFFLPLSFSILIMILGFIYLQFRQTQRKGKGYILSGIILLLFFSNNFTSDWLLRSLENGYPPLGSDAIRVHQASIKWIVVFGDGVVSDRHLPASGQLSDSSMARLVEAIRLSRQLPGAKIILSGGSVVKPGSEAEVMAKVAQTLDIKSKQIILDSLSRDTEEQVARVRNIAGKDQFIFVTSASHMPRCMALFKKAGTCPIPAPVHFLASKLSDPVEPSLFFPSAAGLKKSEVAIHEYLGMLWAKVRWKI